MLLTQANRSRYQRAGLHLGSGPTASVGGRRCFDTVLTPALNQVTNGALGTSNRLSDLGHGPPLFQPSPNDLPNRNGECTRHGKLLVKNTVAIRDFPVLKH
jgi:hypothetical protein